MREFEGDCLVVAASFGCFQLHPKFIEFNREKFDRHVAVERFSISPALHSIFIGQFLVYREKSIQLIIIDVTVLKGTGVNHLVDAGEYLVPLFLVLLYRYRLLLCESSAGRCHRLFPVDPG